MMNWNEATGSQVTEFILMGITNHPELQGPLFVVFFLNSMVTVVGNLGLIILTSVDSYFNTPMYFFLRHLAFVDLGYSTVIGPTMMVSFIEEKKYYILSWLHDAAIFGIFIASELFMLLAMAFDRYVAIYKPLLYMAIVSDRVCWILVARSYLYGIFLCLVVVTETFKSSFCQSNMRNFYCECLPLLAIACSDTSNAQLIIMIFAVLNLVSSLLVILISYMLILVAIIRMNSSKSRYKAFSTCGSHFTGVVIFYGTLLFMYPQPQSRHSFNTDKTASVFYTLVISMLNSLIYSLRNKEVKGALKRLFKKSCKPSL